MTDETARWSSIRASIGVVKGSPADAVTDTEALHDELSEAPAGFRFTPIPDDLFPTYFLCSYTTRYGR